MISFRTANDDGFSDATFVLLRRIDWDYPDLDDYEDWWICES